MKRLTLLLMLFACACGNGTGSKQTESGGSGGAVGSGGAGGQGGTGGEAGAGGSGGAGLCTVCVDEGAEDCDACFSNIGKCCLGDPTYMGQASIMAEVCSRDPCRTCCNECAALTCDEMKARGNCVGDME